MIGTSANRGTVIGLVVLLGLGAGMLARAQPQTQTQPQTQPQRPTASATPSIDDLTAAIAKLGTFDLPARIEASRLVRRTPSAIAVPALTKAARAHADSYVRYRALVLLTGFGEAAATDTMRDVIADRDDRLRTVAFTWFARHPDAAARPALLAAMAREQSEFVRPALIEAVAASGGDPAVRNALLPLVTRGEDLFRGAAIQALGEARAAWALPAITDVAKLDGPLQDDALVAMGRIGDRASLPVLAAIQRTAPRDIQPAVAVATCLVETQCAATVAALERTLSTSIQPISAEGEPVRFAEDMSVMVGAVSHALGVLAARGQADALTALLDAGGRSLDRPRTLVALSFGTVALRRPLLLIETLDGRAASRAADIALLRDAFDLLAEEDLEQEQFFSEVRNAYWNAAAGSARRALAEALMGALEI